MFLKNSVIAACVWIALSLGAAVAQDSGFEPLEEVVVTARKSEERILEIPIAVTAFTATDIENLGLTEIGDLQNFTPGFNYESFGTTVGRNDNIPRFRGVTTNTANPLRQTATVFVDGIYVANGVQGIDFADIARIEAIKGPQSAYFGRSTFGGAVNFVTRTPADEFGARVGASIASENEWRINGSTEFPVSDSLRLRLSGSFHDKAGQYDSTTDGGETGAEETWSAAAALYFEPSDNFDARFRVSIFENDDGPAAAGIVGQDLLNCGPTSFEADPNFPGVVPGQAGPLGGQEAFFCGSLPSPDPNIPTVMPESLSDSLAGLGTFNGPGSRRDQDGFGLDRVSVRTSLQFSYQFENGLVLSSLTGINREEVNQVRVGEGNNLGPPAFFSANSRKFDDVSQELRLQGSASSDRIEWSIGANYFEQDFESSGLFGLFPSGFAFGDGNSRDGNYVETVGIFGSISYEVSDAVRVTLEGRYQEDDITEDGDITDAVPGLNSTFSNFLPRAIIEVTPNENQLIYLSYSVGNLPGGFNPDFIELNDADRAIVVGINPFSSETFEEEELAQFEVGLKQSFERGSISTALYYLDRTEQTVRDTTQATLSTGDEFINQFLNIGRSEATGIEVEGEWRLTDNLLVTGGLSVIDSEFKEFASANVLRARGNADASGFTNERFPDFQGNFSWQYDGRVNSNWSWYFRNDNSLMGERFASEVNLATADEAFVSNARLGFRSDNLSLELFVTNLTDEDSPVAAVRSTDLGSVVTRTAGARPFDFLIGLRDRRQYGIRLSYTY